MEESTKNEPIAAMSITYVYCVMSDASGQRIAYLDRAVRMPAGEWKAHETRGRYISEVPLSDVLELEAAHVLAKQLCLDSIKKSIDGRVQ